MEFFNHVQKLYTETDHQTLNLDLPLAVFMIKLLSIKVDFGHFRDENKFNEYMKSDRPLKLRYYLQIKFREELTESTEEAIEEMKEEYEYIKECFEYDPKFDRWVRETIPPYEKRNELYEDYLKDKDFDEVSQYKISEWIKPDMVNGSINSDIRSFINIELNKKYSHNPENLKNNIINFMNRFSTKESVDKLLYSMKDVYILGLV
jgi:hypothetical protein